MHHFYVLYKVDKKTVTIMDPGGGRLIRMDHEAFKQEWTGVMVLIAPSQRFEKGNQRADGRGRGAESKLLRASGRSGPCP